MRGFVVQLRFVGVRVRAVQLTVLRRDDSLALASGTEEPGLPGRRGGAGCLSDLRLRRAARPSAGAPRAARRRCRRRRGRADDDEPAVTGGASRPGTAACPWPGGADCGMSEHRYTARVRGDDALAHRSGCGGCDGAPAQRPHGRATGSAGGRQRSIDGDANAATPKHAATRGHRQYLQSCTERRPACCRGLWHGARPSARLRSSAMALVCAVGAVLLGASGCGGAGLQEGPRGPNVHRFVPAAYTPPLDLGAQGIDPIAPETRTFTPGFRVRELRVEGGAPVAGRAPPAFAAAAAPVALPAGPGLNAAAQETSHAGSQTSPVGGGAPGLPIGSHLRIAGARRNWVDRRAAMEQALAVNASSIENNYFGTRAHDTR
jgi:hypothetical protein